jgi:purine catabolism regulator
MAGTTLTAVLQLPAFRRAGPAVLAGHAGLDRDVRWAHATELVEVQHLLRPGDLVLTMGTGLPADDDVAAMGDFARTLADVGTAGLVVELGRRWRTGLPSSLVEACDARGLPVIALSHETSFAALTQAIGEHVVESQLSELREAQHVHDTFTELSFTGADPGDILQAVQQLAGGPVVVENARHRPLDYLQGRDGATGFLDDWQARSARVAIVGRTGWDATNGWLVTRLGTRDEAWGRLVIESAEEPSQRLVAVAERAGAALALHRLHDRHRDNAVRRQHRELMQTLVSTPDAEDVARRCELAAFPVVRRQLLGVVVRSPAAHRGAGDLEEIVATVLGATHALRVPALVCEVERDVRVLLSTPASTDIDSVADRLAQRVAEHHDVVIAAGRSVGDRTQVESTMLEAIQVADALPSSAQATPSAPARRLQDLHLRGLLTLLGDDDRIRLFVERELAPLRSPGREGRQDLVAALRALLLHPGSKSDAAASLHLSRAAFYDRLARIEAVLGVDLNDPDTRLSLHVALVAEEMSSQRSSR